MTVAAGDAHSYPIYAGRFRLEFPIYDGDGDLVSGAADLDSEYSLNQATFTDCTNEATEIDSTGWYYLDLTSTETTGKSVAVQVKTSTATAKTTPLFFTIERLPILRSGTAQAGAAGTITLDSGASSKDGAYVGLFIQCTNNSPSNVLGQTRKIISYVGSTKVATVDSNWGTNPSSATTFAILIPLSVNAQAHMGQEYVDWTTSGVPNVALTSAGLDNVVIESGTNARQAMSLMAAAAAGKMSGGGTTNVIFKGAGVETTRIDATVDVTGNRSSITLTPPA